MRRILAKAEPALASGKFAGMRDFVVLPYSHFGLEWHREAIEQTRAFLRDGHFRAFQIKL